MKPFLEQPPFLLQKKSYKKTRSSLDISARTKHRQSQDSLASHCMKKQWQQKQNKKQNRTSIKNRIKTNKNSATNTKNNSPRKVYLAAEKSTQKDINIQKQYRYFYQIGLGAFGKVWKVGNKQTGQQYALKTISKQKIIEEDCVAAVLCERSILTQLNNGFIINMHRCFQDRDNIYILLDYLRGADLRYHICYKQTFTQSQIKFIAANVILALEHIHEHKIIHRDIKPENIIFEQNGYLRITDFGIAKVMDEQKCKMKTQCCGTPVYMAPQILFKQQYSYQSDFYALVGKRPYLGKTRTQIRSQLINRQICLSRIQVGQQYSQNLINLINKLLKKNPIDRLGYKGIKQIKQHSFFKTIKWKKLSKKQIKPPYVPTVISQTRQYLNQIALFNEMRNKDATQPCRIDTVKNEMFANFNFESKQKLTQSIRYLKSSKRRSMQRII